MQDRIEGTVLPVLIVELQPGETVMSEVGEFSWMSDSIQIATGSATPGKGLMAAAKRMAGGATFLFNRFSAEGSPGMVAFATKLPGAIFPIDLQEGVEYFAHRHGFMAGTTEIEVSVALQQTFKGGIFGGEGFILQHLKGAGRAWIEMSGEISTYDLQPGQSMRVHPGHVALFQASVTFQVVRVPGLANRYLGDDGHHFVVLTGPGRIWLQSMPIPILAGALEPYLGDSHPAAAGAAGGAAAGVIGGLLRGR